jgi:hypothetical protein
LIHIKATLSASHIFQVKLSKIAEAYMSETQTHTEKAFPFSFDTSEFAALGKKRMEAFVNAQTELLDEIQEANRHWMDRFQSEANLASEYASNLSGARTIPDAMAVTRGWPRTASILRMTTANSWKRARGCSQTGRRPRRKRSF